MVTTHNANHRPVDFEIHLKTSALSHELRQSSSLVRADRDVLLLFLNSIIAVWLFVEKCAKIVLCFHLARKQNFPNSFVFRIFVSRES